MPTYSGISSEAFRHPLDKQAEQTLRSVPGFDILAKKFVEYLYERPQRIFLMDNSIKVGPRQYFTLYEIFQETVKDLDIYPEPTLYVSQNSQVNAYSLGHEEPNLIINTTLNEITTQEKPD